MGCLLDVSGTALSGLTAFVVPKRCADALGGILATYLRALQGDVRAGQERTEVSVKTQIEYPNNGRWSIAR
eukprot:9489810-Pyramimonas_sp.AAC.1